jgi:predicted DNA-binding transcriptional regulator YafY
MSGPAGRGRRPASGSEKDLSAVQRLVALCRVLGEHPELGLPAEAILDSAGYTAPNPDSRKDMLSRDIRQLRALGLRIENVAGPGQDARYRLIPGDDRIRVQLTAAEQLALRSANVGGAGPADEIAPPRVAGALDLVQRAVASNAVIRFQYSGRPRVLHPYGLTPGDRGGWLCHGWEQGPQAAKSFAVGKMRGVSIDPPGSADAPPLAGIPTLDPFRFAIDPPSVAELEVLEAYLDEVVADLHEPHRSAGPVPGAHGQAVRLLTYEVTNRRYFVHRVLRLGERVRLVGDATMRAALAAMLVPLAREVG